MKSSLFEFVLSGYFAVDEAALQAARRLARARDGAHSHLQPAAARDPWAPQALASNPNDNAARLVDNNGQPDCDQKAR